MNCKNVSVTTNQFMALAKLRHNKFVNFYEQSMAYLNLLSDTIGHMPMVLAKADNEQQLQIFAVINAPQTIGIGAYLPNPIKKAKADAANITKMGLLQANSAEHFYPLIVSNAISGYLIIAFGNNPPTATQIEYIGLACSELSSIIEERERLLIRNRVESLTFRTDEIFRTVINALPGVIYRRDYNCDGLIYFVGPQIADITGNLAANYINHPIEHFTKDIFLPDLANIRKNTKAIPNAPIIELNHQFRCVNKFGQQVWLADKGHAQFDSSIGKYVVNGMLFDITKQKQAEEQLEESKLQMALIAQNTTDALIAFNFEGKVCFASPATLQITGYNPDDIVNINPLSLIGSKYKFSGLKSIVPILRQATQQALVTLQIIHKNGKAVWVECSVKRLKRKKLYDWQFVVSARDITQRIELEAERERNRQQLEYLFRNLPNGFVSLDLSTLKVLQVSQGFCNLFDIDAQTALELDAYKLFQRTLNVKSKSLWGKLISAQLGASLSLTVNMVSQRRHLRIDAVKSQINGITRLDAIITDATDRYQREQIVREKQLAESALRLKNDIIANIGHEVRTPLKGIVGWLNLLSAEPYGSKAYEYIENSITAATNLQKLLNDILELSRLDSGTAQNNPTTFELNKLLNEVYLTHKNEAFSKGIDLIWNNPDNADEPIKADRIKIAQIMNNLLSNAVKFTSKGSVRVNTTLTDNQTVVFEVVDTGVGIKPDQHTKVFEKFFRSGEIRERTFDGAGLGLSISNELAKVIGGSITLKSEFGKGSTFKFEFPYKISKTLGTANRSEIVEKDIKRYLRKVFKALVVEDNQMTRRLTQALLEHYGGIVKVAASAAEAYEVIESEKFDFVFIDVLMPKINGVEATKYIKNQLKADTIIIGLSANTLAEVETLFGEIPFDFYYEKPLTEAILFEIMELWQGRVTKVQQSPLIDIGGLENISQSQLASLFDQARTDFNQLINQLKNAHQQSDLVAIRTIHHNLKGLAMVLNLTSTSQVIAQIPTIETDIGIYIKNLHDALTSDFLFKGFLF